MFIIKAKSDKGKEGLIKMHRELQSRKARLVCEVHIIEQMPFVLSFKYIKKAMQIAAHDKGILKTLYDGLINQIETNYDLEAKDFEVEYNG